MEKYMQTENMVFTSILGSSSLFCYSDSEVHVYIFQNFFKKI